MMLHWVLEYLEFTQISNDSRITTANTFVLEYLEFTQISNTANVTDLTVTVLEYLQFTQISNKLDGLTNILAKF